MTAFQKRNLFKDQKSDVSGIYYLDHWFSNFFTETFGTFILCNLDNTYHHMEDVGRKGIREKIP